MTPTDEQVEAALKAYWHVEDGDINPAVPMRAALEAAFATIPTPTVTPEPGDVAGLVAIKPLEWNEETSEPGWWMAESRGLFLGYEVRTNSRGVVRVRFPGKTWETFEGDVEAAKAAAQADYEARIRSELVAAPALPAPQGIDDPSLAYWTPERLLESYAPAPALPDGWEMNDKDRDVLFFTSYCGKDDDDGCSDSMPCKACLDMSNVFRIRAGTPIKYVRHLSAPSDGGSRG